MAARGLFDTQDSPLLIAVDAWQPRLPDPPTPPGEPPPTRPRTLSERLAEAAAERERHGIRLDAQGLPII